MAQTKKITIPKEFGYPTIEVWINGDKHSLETGKEIEVTEKVAEVIEAKINIHENLLTPDGNVGSSGGGGAQADWNASEGEAGHVKNRTHYETVETVSEPLNITWDGNTEGLVCVADMLYKVSDAVLTDEQIKSATVGVSDGTTLTISALWDEAVMITDELVAPCEYVLFVRKEGAYLNGMTFSDVGIYFVNVPDVLYASSLTTTEPVEQTKTVVHKLDKKYLPDVSDLDADWLAELKTALGIGDEKQNYSPR